MPTIELPDGKIAEFPDSMSQDDIRSVLQKKFPPKQEAKKSLLERANDYAEENINKPIEKNIVNPANSLAAGFEQGIANIPSGLANLGGWALNKLPGMNIPKAPSFDFAPHNMPAEAGNIASFFAGPGGIAKGISKLSELEHVGNAMSKMPMIAEGLSKASNVIKNNPFKSSVAGGSIMGGAYMPENPGLGLALGAGAAPLGAGVAKLASKGKGVVNSIMENPTVKNIVEKFSPHMHAEKIIQDLSGGSKNLAENSRSLATDIRKAHDDREAEASIFYNHVKDKVGNDRIYEREDPLISTRRDNSKDSINQIKDLKVGKTFKEFEKNPTFQNTHNLQSELGTWIGDFSKKPHKTPEEKAQLSSVKQARDRLKSDMVNFLEKHDKTANQPLLPMYKKGSELYEKNVAPFLSDKKIRNIVRGRKTDVKNIHTVFENPANIINRKGEEKLGDINKIISFLPSESKNKILFNAIGTRPKDANKLLDRMRVVEKGYGDYITPELKESLNALNSKIKNKENLVKYSSYAGAGALTDLAFSQLLKR